MNSYELTQKDTATAGFDFGRGHTALDRHVAWIATDHHGYDYAKQWTSWQWQISQDCLTAFKRNENHFVMDNTAPLPHWLVAAIGKHATPDTDSPSPSCFAVQSAAIDWFALAREHPQELVLAQWFEPAPTLMQIEQALRAAQARSAEVSLWITCAPPAQEGGAFDVSLEALFVTPRDGDVELEALVEHELGGVVAFIDPSQPRKLEWAWMTYWPEPSTPTPVDPKEIDTITAP